MRTLHHLEVVLETMRCALNRLTAADSAWVQSYIPEVWFQRYGLRAEQARRPKAATQWEALGRVIASNGYQLLA